MQQGWHAGPNTGVLRRLPPYESLRSFELALRGRGEIDFSRVFREPLGFYLIKCFLIADYGADKVLCVGVLVCWGLLDVGK